jgi:hypothetical protein
MAMATRVVGKEEGEVGKGDGDGNEEAATKRRRDGDETTTRRQRDDVMTTRRRQDDAGARKKQRVGRGWIQSKIQGICGPIIQQAVQKQQGFGVNM